MLRPKRSWAKCIELFIKVYLRQIIEKRGMKMNKETITDYRQYVLVSGTAKVTKESIVYTTSEYIGVSFMIDKESHCVADADFNTLSDMHSMYLRQIVLGFCMDDPIEQLLQEIKQHVYIAISGSVLQAIRNLAERYKTIEGFA